MNLIIPMAGQGKRMRPHTLMTPKPLIPVGGKPIVQRLVEDIAAMCDESINEIGFIIGDFGDVVEKELLDIASSLGAKGKIYYQDIALGTGHAIYCAEPLLTGPVIVAFADTLFRADFKIDPKQEGTIWVKQIEDPSQFGVVKVNEVGAITDFVEKPKDFVSDLAIIGIYFFKDGDHLKRELKYLMDNNIVKGGEYQLTDALENMKQQGVVFRPGTVDHWMDCGNKNATVETNRMILEFEKDQNLVSSSAVIENSTLIQPVQIADGVRIENSVVGPHVSVGKNAVIKNARVSNSIVRSDSSINNAVIENSLIGMQTAIDLSALDLSMGDFSTMN
ncbi:sugar phosphate nucleotidyltransferase [Salibacteraceae bacterium]|jgi:glucose-1-phosphate thymidylyltransferase|nr:sugar phosphate nucleotidyltransferase [Salibacteraceae bacterium]MDC1220170.1 sugar phosphate nucleotidyltransferase [bacterium]HAQ72247.1 nucleotidyltransferase [Flavobacteriales bacterium]MDB4104405.1 sugar phosphate nucleotidyltransferase [Salibacteraceae bacterium]MDB9708662.1 sugar phosphate nucleotidyltransferase [Salibacteraceae bacterium]